MERCEYFDTVAQQYSTEGCETVQLVDGGLACQCTHLSEFLSLKVPTDFDDKIQFASLDVPTELCLHCACTKGVELMLTKSDEPGASNLVRQDVAPLTLTLFLPLTLPLTATLTQTLTRCARTSTCSASRTSTRSGGPMARWWRGGSTTSQ